MNFTTFDGDLINLDYLMNAYIDEDEPSKVVFEFREDNDLNFEFKSKEEARSKLDELICRLSAVQAPPIRK